MYKHDKYHRIRFSIALVLYCKTKIYIRKNQNISSFKQVNLISFCNVFFEVQL